MPVIRKIISITIVAMMAFTTISGPQVLRSVSRRTEASSDEMHKPNGTESAAVFTSRDLDCYILDESLCNRKGEPVKEYLLDLERNITDLSGNIIVSTENTEQFTCASEVRYNENDLRQYLKAMPEDGRKDGVSPASFSMQLYVRPTDAVNGTITLTSRNPEKLYFPNMSYDNNPENHIGADHNPASVTVTPDENGMVEVFVAAATQGHSIVTVGNVLEEEIEKLEFVLLSEDSSQAKQSSGMLTVDASTGSVPSGSDRLYKTDPIDGHEHVYKTQTMSPTIRTKGYTLHVCTICGYTYRDNYTDLDLCQHNWRIVKTVAGTGSSAGYTLYECTVCGQQERRDPPQQTPSGGTQVCGHLICSKIVTAATCTSGGYTFHECLICHDFSYTDEETPALGHSWNEGNVSKEASCMENGVRVFTCKNCRKTKSESIPATGHLWNDGVVVVTPAEKEAGVRTYTCQYCGTTRTEEIPAAAHDWDEGIVTQEPTCISTGTKIYTCRLTGETRTEELEKLPHAMTEEIIPATASEGGYTRHYCSECGYEEDRTDFTEPLTHEHIFQNSRKEPTCTEEGYSVFICETCGEEKDRTVLEARGHWFELNAVETTDEEDGFIDFSCVRCGHSFQGFYLKPPAAYELSEDAELDLDAVAEAGRNWLRENGMEISEAALDVMETKSVDIAAQQDSAESIMEKLCFDSVLKALREYQEDLTLKPVFNCICRKQEGTGLAELQCVCSFFPSETLAF